MSTEVHAHHEHPDVVGSRNRLGVILILVADIAFALAVLFTYFYLFFYLLLHSFFQLLNT